MFQDLYRRGLQGRQLQLVVTDGCAGLAVALQTLDRIIYSIFNRFNLEWRQHTVRQLHKQLDITIVNHSTHMTVSGNPIKLSLKEFHKVS